jgi:hypothetical protein
MYITNAGYLSLSSISFIGNIGANGSSVFASDLSKGVFTEIRCVDNQAAYKGGCFLFNRCRNIQFTDS